MSDTDLIYRVKDKVAYVVINREAQRTPSVRKRFSSFSNTWTRRRPTATSGLLPSPGPETKPFAPVPISAAE